jgi:hypothetical protein
VLLLADYLCTLCVQEFANLPDWVSSRANNQVAWVNTLMGQVWHMAGAGEGAGDGAGGDLTHRLLSRLEPAIRVSNFTQHTVSVL